jgi:hypothetical protein
MIKMIVAGGARVDEEAREEGISRDKISQDYSRKVVCSQEMAWRLGNELESVCSPTQIFRPINCTTQS